MKIEERKPLLKLERNKKIKLNIRIGNIALDQIIKDIKPKDVTTVNELTYSTAKDDVQKDVVWKRKTEIELATNNQPGNVTFRKKLKLLEVNYQELSKRFIKRDQCKDQGEAKS